MVGFGSQQAGRTAAVDVIKRLCSNGSQGTPQDLDVASGIVIQHILVTFITATYIQDDLTALRAKIAYKARQLRNEGKLNDTWVFDSRVLVKDLHNHIKQVNCLNNLNIY